MAVAVSAATQPGGLPPEIAALLPQLLGDEGIFFVPVRHHSPACAWALRHLLREVRPAAVLIEGPDDLDPLLPLLQDPLTRTPVAWLCQATREARAEPPAPGEERNEAEPEPAGPRTVTSSSFYPLCDYSPEWIAVREGAALGAQVALIDLPWRHKAWERRYGGGDDGEETQAPDTARSQMEERHFAHSRYLNAMARQLGCVDHHDLWDRLFELRAPEALADWRTLFADVFSWCAMARQDYEPEVLEAELSLPRERHMAAHIRRWRSAVSGPIVVVTGGFHTTELLRSWKTAPPLAAPTKPAAKKNRTAEPDAWLIRYSFEQLDALNGYGAGMPSPGYYQQVWEALEDRALRDAPAAQAVHPLTVVALGLLTRFAQQTRAQDQTDAVSTALVQAAALQAVRLAELRGNAGPGRQDVLDAIRSCFVKGAMDEGMRGFTADLRAFLGGTRIGDVPPSAGSPPLIEDARRLARAAGVRLDDSASRGVRLDLYRKPSHRERSRFFHAMAYLDAGLAQWVAGPDFIAGSRLNMLFEEWRAAWSPMVEARLIALASDGASVEAVCLARLMREEAALSDQGRGRSASAAVALLQRACLVGLHARLPQLLAMLSAHLDEDASLGSVAECGHRLVTLWRAREPLGVQQNPQLAGLLQRVWPAALYLLPPLAQTPADGQEQAVRLLLSLRELGRLLASLGAEDNTSTIDAGLLVEHLTRFATGAGCAPGVAGAATALLYLDGHWDDAALDAVVRQRFGPGALPQEAVQFLSGMMTAAPELLLRLPALLHGLDRLVRQWDDAAFVAYLPDLRQAFTGLRPQETADLASQVARLHGTDEATAATLAGMHYETTEEDLHAGLRLQALLEASLQRDGLQHWIR